MMNDIFNDQVVSDLFAAEGKAQEAVTLRKAFDDNRLCLAVSNLLASEDGKLVICAILDQTGTFTSSFTGNSSTFFLEGKRFVGLYLYQLLMLADPLALQKLLEFRREQEALKHNGRKTDE